MSFFLKNYFFLDTWSKQHYNSHMQKSFKMFAVRLRKSLKIYAVTLRKITKKIRGAIKWI